VAGLTAGLANRLSGAPADLAVSPPGPP